MRRLAFLALFVVAALALPLPAGGHDGPPPGDAEYLGADLDDPLALGDRLVDVDDHDTFADHEARHLVVEPVDADHRVAADLRRDAGAVTAVLVVDVLQHLFAPFMLEIDVDVGRLVTFGADEPLEEHVDSIGVNGGDSQTKTHGGVGRAAPPLAQDASPTGKSHKVPNG